MAKWHLLFQKINKITFLMELPCPKNGMKRLDRWLEGLLLNKIIIAANSKWKLCNMNCYVAHFKWIASYFAIPVEIFHNSFIEDKAKLVRNQAVILSLTEHPIPKSNWFWKPFIPCVICRQTHFKHVFHAEHENDDHDIDDIIMMLTHLLSILLSTSLNFSNSRLSSPLHTDMPSLTSHPNLSLKIKSKMKKIDFVIFASSPFHHLLELVHVSHVDLGDDRRVHGMFRQRTIRIADK